MNKIIVSFVAIIFFIPGIAAQIADSGTKRFILDPVEIENEWDGKYFSIRTVYVLVNEEDFSSNTATSLVKEISMKFPKPKKLSIYIFSEKSRRESYKEYRNPGISIAFPDTPDGRRAHEYHDESRRPKPVGHFAHYFRDEGGFEVLHITEKSGDDYLIPVDLTPHPNS